MHVDVVATVTVGVVFAVATVVKKISVSVSRFFAVFIFTTVEVDVGVEVATLVMVFVVLHGVDVARGTTIAA